MGDDRQLILAHMIRAWVERDPDRKVLTFVDVDDNGQFTDETRTYSELWENGQRIAAALADEGMEAGDRFAIMIQNHPEFVDAMIGSSIAGTIFVPIDPRTQGRKLRYMLEFAGCTGLMASEQALSQVAAVGEGIEGLEWLWTLGEPDNTPRLPGRLAVRAVAGILDTAPPPPRAVHTDDPTRPMQMLYTSGTTGDPKAILSPHARFGTIASLGSVIGLREGDRPYTGLSLTHANAQLITLGNVLRMGLEGVFSRRFTKSRLWEITRRYQCTMFNLLGGMTTAIYSEPEHENDADNPVRYVLSAGMPAAIWDRFRERFGVEIFEFYGTAEGGLALNPPGAGPVGSIGKPPPTMVARIVDDEDRECPPGVSGELIFRNADGTCPPVAYYRNEKASKEKTLGGWFRTGDICHADEQGWLYFDYRKGDSIRCNGDFIDPTYVEKEIGEHPDVDDVFAYGVEAESGVPGESDLIVAVVWRGESVPDADAIYAWCRTRLERNSVPRYVQFMEEIPKTASEKPMKRFCQQHLSEHPENVFQERASA